MTKSKDQEAIVAINSAGYASPGGLAVDPVIFSVQENGLCVLVEAGQATLPGGFVAGGQSPETAVTAKLEEKTGLKQSDTSLEQLRCYADPDRDPRGWIISIAYIGLLPASMINDDSRQEWVRASDPGTLKYDHNQIIDSALARVRDWIWRSNIAAGLLEKTFTIGQARYVFDAVLGISHDAGNFSRDLRRSGLVIATGENAGGSGAGRPAELYRFADASPNWNS